MATERTFRICARCVMDSSDPDIIFDDNGFCNHCTTAIETLTKYYFVDSSKQKENLQGILKQIKLAGRDKKYDCIIGLSGGVDSTYLALIAVKEFGLRPLAVHLDNGWNTEIAIHNIHNTVNFLGIDLITYVLNWEEFRQIQLAFFRSSVVDLELTSDYAIFACINSIARKNGIKYFLIGSNIVSESIMPRSWFYGDKLDFLNIKDIVKKFGDVKFDTYPKISFNQYLFWNKGSIKRIPLLYYLHFDRTTAMDRIETELQWRNYGGKHRESKITEFYQKYILPQKYNIDKRKAHLSSLICSQQLTREDALAELRLSPFDNSIIEEDISYFCKKIGITRKEFDQLMTAPITKHSNFKSFSARKKFILKLLGKDI